MSKLTAEQAARRLRLTDEVFAELARRGRVFSDQHGLYSTHDLDALFRSNRVLAETTSIRKEQARAAAEKAAEEKSPAGLRSKAVALKKQAADCLRAAEVLELESRKAADNEALESAGVI